MSRTVLIYLLGLCCIATGQGQTDPNQPTGQIAASSQPPRVTIEGLVRDIACAIQNPEATATDFNLDCALKCARHGSPLIIQTKDGELYIPISDSMPDRDQRARLMPFVGKYVRASGSVFVREGTRAIVIGEIKEMKDVHLKTK
jgi:hypothetical protein